MSSQYYPGRTTPETMVGGLEKWKQLTRTNITDSFEPFGDGFRPVIEQDCKEDLESNREPFSKEDQPDEYEEEYTEWHYSESEFDTEQEEDHEEEVEEKKFSNEPNHGQIQVSRYPPKHFKPDSHLLHIDFITDQIERFELAEPERDKAQGRQGSGMATKRLPRHQHNMSFNRERVREIERTNQILLKRILSTRPTLQTQPSRQAKSSSATTAPRVTSGALNRRKVQKRIAGENEILLRKVNSIALMKRGTC